MINRLLLVAVAMFVAVTAAAGASDSTRDVMLRVTIPASTAIFDVVDAPTTPAAWQAVRDQAARLTATDAALNANTPAAGAAEWRAEVQAHISAAADVEKAAAGKNFEAMLEASDRLADTCVSCHKTFMKQ